MTPIDWTAVMLGLGAGTVISAVFFAGLGWGMRMALRSAKPVVVLMASAVVRIAVLLGLGWGVAGLSGPWALLGYAVAFLMVRFTVTGLARVSAPAGDAP